MTTPRSSTSGHDARDRPMPPTGGDAALPDTGPDDRPGYGGGMFGYPVNAREAVLDSTVGTTHGSDEASRRARDERDREDDVPVGSALRTAQDADSTTADAGGDLASGPNTLGATTGGERAVAGRTDANRNSRDDHSSLDSGGGMI